jgi:hypothetical protein
MNRFVACPGANLLTNAANDRLIYFGGYNEQPLAELCCSTRPRGGYGHLQSGLRHRTNARVVTSAYWL